MKMIKLILICIFVHANYAYAGTIFMKIFPVTTFETGAVNRPNVDMMFVTLEGNFKENPVHLVTSESCNSAPKQMNVFLKDGTKKQYSPETLEVALNSGDMDRYPLAWHKQFKNLPEDTELRLVECDSRGNEVVQIDLPEVIASAILHYLTKDIESRERDCWDFIKTIRFNFDDRYSGGLHHHIQAVALESEVVRGDIGICFDIFVPEIYIIHYALALGNGMYLSKHGYGGPLMVSNIQSMLAFWGAKYLGKLDREATENSELWVNGARIDPRT